MTKDELRDGIRKSFSLIDERNLFWRYIGQQDKLINDLQARIAEIIRIAGETLAYFIDCPHEVDDWNHPTHDCEKCDSCNADSCFCWEIWLKERLSKEQGREK